MIYVSPYNSFLKLVIMEIKKSKNAELESRKGTWFALGIIIVLSFMFITFEWTEYDKQIDLTGQALNPVVEMTLVPITMPDVVKPPPPPAPVAIEQLIVLDEPVEVPDIILHDPEDVGIPIDIGTYRPPIEADPEVIETTPVDFAEVMPEFPGGQAALLSYLSKNMRYPSIAQEMNIQGRVIVRFVVDRDGSITDPEVLRSVDPHLDREALRVISSMPKWSPGYQRGTKVRVRYTVPVTFKLQ